MTKNELILKVNHLANEYLGFQSSEAGLSRLNKEQLQVKIDKYTMMVEHDRAAKAIRARYHRDWALWLGMVGKGAPLADRQDFWDMSWNYIHATIIWLNGTDRHLAEMLKNLGPRPEA